MAGEISLESIMQAIQSVDIKVGSLHSDLSEIKVSLTSMNAEVKEVQLRVSANQDDIVALTKRVKALEKSNAYLQERAEDAENRNRRSNLRFVSIPLMDNEPRDLAPFIAQLIPKLFGEENFPAPPVVERAHRIPVSKLAAPSSGSEAIPRHPTILAKFLNFQDKLKIQQLAREKGEIQLNGSRMFIFPDYSPELLKKRRKYDSVKKKLREAGITYSMVFPASLKVELNGKPTLFNTPGEAYEFLRIRDDTHSTRRKLFGLRRANGGANASMASLTSALSPVHIDPLRPEDDSDE